MLCRTKHLVENVCRAASGLKAPNVIAWGEAQRAEPHLTWNGLRSGFKTWALMQRIAETHRVFSSGSNAFWARHKAYRAPLQGSLESVPRKRCDPASRQIR